jgi:hypothetical protein
MPSELTPALRAQIENTIRGLTIDAVEAAGIGHLGAPMGLARPVFQLWDRHLRFDSSDPAWPLRDRFVLSAGHASMLLYSLLHLFGYGSRSMRSSASASFIRRRRGTPSLATRPVSRSPPARSARASATPSAWRSQPR